MTTGLWALLIGSFVGGSMDVHNKGGLYTSETACQSVQVQVIEDNRKSVMDGTLVVVCVERK